MVAYQQTEKLHRRTGSCYKHSITAENSTTRDSLNIKEAFGLWIRFLETGLGRREKKKKLKIIKKGGEWRDRGKLFGKWDR